MKPITKKIRNPRTLRAMSVSTVSVEEHDNKDNMYGITERKKAEIDALANEVLNNQAEVDQLQAIVTALTQKSNKLQSQLNSAQSNKAIALSNNDLVDEVLNNARDLMESSEKTYVHIIESEAYAHGLSKEIEDVINKLIYSVEVINKLSALVTRKKANNPLISDELIAVLAKAGENANNAVALTMNALKSVFASQATISESESSLALEYLQSVKLMEFILGEDLDATEREVLEPGIKTLLQHSYDESVALYETALEALQDTLNQLDNAKDDLSQAQIRLSSSQAGLAAANAAALAS